MIAAIPPKNNTSSNQTNANFAKPSLHAVMQSFLHRKDSDFVLGSRVEYEHACLMLQEYINSFGRVMLRSAGVEPTVPTSGKALVSQCYDPASLIGFFRGSVLFFLQFKVTAPAELKETFTKIIDEFICWLGAEGHLPVGLTSDLRTIDSRTSYLASRVGAVLSNAIAHSGGSGKSIEDVRQGEPLYMVSRKRSGKLWFIYYEGKQYDEFGPVSVPLGVSDIVRPGWLLDCDFAKYGGRWQLVAVRSILPI